MEKKTDMERFCEAQGINRQAREFDREQRCVCREPDLVAEQPKPDVCRACGGRVAPHDPMLVAGDFVKVIDNESGFVGWTGEVVRIDVDRQPIVRFRSEHGQHDRFVKPEQLEVLPAVVPARNPSSYAAQIRESLAQHGFVGLDPRHIEAWMRSDRGTLDALTTVGFDKAVVEAALCVVLATPEKNEALAESFGLGGAK